MAGTVAVLGLISLQDELFCTSYVVAHYLRHSLQLKGTVYLVGMPGFGHELELQGIPYTGPGVRREGERERERVCVCVCVYHLQEDPQVGSVAELLDTQLEPEVTEKHTNSLSLSLTHTHTLSLSLSLSLSAGWGSCGGI